jgi:hypothetical protein
MWVYDFNTIKKLKELHYLLYLRGGQELSIE